MAAFSTEREVDVGRSGRKLVLEKNGGKEVGLGILSNSWWAV